MDTFLSKSYLVITQSYVTIHTTHLQFVKPASKLSAAASQLYVLLIEIWWC